MTTTDTNDDIEFSDPREEEESHIDEIPKGERNLRTQAYDKCVSDIVTMIGNGDIILDPEYQRNYIWEDKRASLLIESILLNVPIPAIYVAEDEEGRWNVVDGLQRLYSLKRFFSNELKLRGLEVLEDLNRCFYRELNPKASRILRNGILRIILIFNDSHPDIKYEIFARLNRGSIQLNEQELRNCLYRGPFNNLLQELRRNDIFQSLIGRDEPHKRMVDAELILRHFTVKEGYVPESGKITTYSGNMRSSLNHFMKANCKASSDKIKELKSGFLQTLLKVGAVFEDHAFRKIDSDGQFDERVNRALMDAIMVGVGYHSKEALVARTEEIIDLLRRLMNDDDRFLDAITLRTSDKGKMEYRVHTWTTELRVIIGT